MPEERQRDDVDLGVAEVPEQVLPEHHAAVGGVEGVRAEQPVGHQREERGRQHREHDEDEQRRDEDRPGEDRHPEHRHSGGAQADHGRHEVDRAEDGAQPAQDQAHDEQVGAEPG
jgi:hypothetical protein